MTGHRDVRRQSSAKVPKPSNSERRKRVGHTVCSMYSLYELFMPELCFAEIYEQDRKFVTNTSTNTKRQVLRGYSPTILVKQESLSFSLAILSVWSMVHPN